MIAALSAKSRPYETEARRQLGGVPRVMSRAISRTGDQTAQLADQQLRCFGVSPQARNAHD